MNGKTTGVVQLAPLPWYEPETYERVCALMHDQDRLFGTYADWLRNAQRTEEHLRGQGARTVRVTLDLVHFPAWCARTGRASTSTDRHARSTPVTSRHSCTWQNKAALRTRSTPQRQRGHPPPN